MKVGDIVYHKANPGLSMVVYDKDENNVWCRWWNGIKFDEDCFIPKELLFDGEQQGKPSGYVKMKHY